MSEVFFASDKTLRFLRIMSFSEGTSLLILLFIAMPLKYMAGQPQYVSIIGMIHGLLFMVLVLLIFLVGSARNWTKSMMLFSFICATLPFGMFVFESKIRKLIKV